MTESEWMISNDPVTMLNAVERDVGDHPDRTFYKAAPIWLSDRKLRLFCCACAMSEVARKGMQIDHYLEVLEASGESDKWQVNVTNLARAWTRQASDKAYAAWLLREIGGNVFRPVTLPKKQPSCRFCESARWSPVSDDQMLCKDCGKLWVWTDDLYKCPWFTSEVLALANVAYRYRRPDQTLDWECLLALADAIEEAGCGQSPLLDHLRTPGPHVMGCHVIDLILGKS
jgi:hypothetical protein